jgi:hypothetical protein
VKQVRLKWILLPAGPAVLREASKPLSHCNYYATAYRDFWRIWGYTQDAIAGVGIKPAIALASGIEASKLAASNEVVRQLRAAGINAVIERKSR